MTAKTNGVSSWLPSREAENLWFTLSEKTKLALPPAQTLTIKMTTTKATTTESANTIWQLVHAYHPVFQGLLAGTMRYFRRSSRLTVVFLHEVRGPFRSTKWFSSSIDLLGPYNGKKRHFVAVLCETAKCYVFWRTWAAMANFSIHPSEEPLSKFLDRYAYWANLHSCDIRR